MDKIDMSLDEIILQERYAMSEHRGSKNHQNKRFRKVPNQNRRQQYAGQWYNKNQQKFKSQQQYNKYNTQEYNMSQQQRNNVQQYNQGKLILSNLHYKVTNQDIFDLFRSYGKILRYTIHYNASGKSLGMAEVVFDRKDAAIQALQRYNGEFLDGRKMHIKLDDAQQKTRSIKDRLGPFPQKRKQVQDQRGPQNKRIRLQKQEFRTEKFPKKDSVHVKFADDPQKTNTIKNRMDSFPQKWKKFQYQNNPQNKIINLKETQISTKESAQKEVVHLKLEDNTQKNSSIKEQLGPSSQKNEQVKEQNGQQNNMISPQEQQMSSKESTKKDVDKIELEDIDEDILEDTDMEDDSDFEENMEWDELLL
ncbi:ALYREF [Cordylochernes scorpioides]|uniref:ALYREF n=1 Tax=Cordylochernes scorpioides TaxID=51811 RepID=A0ABY6LGK9_9ARAC|nr:ALYREF [Cordylochernes scorpioides]